MEQILVIKPYCVTVEETEKAIGKFRLQYSSARITILANLFPADYQRISQNSNIDDKLLYGPHAKPLTKVELIKLIFNLRRRHYDKAFLLIGDLTYDDYRKGKLLTFFTKAKESRLYFTRTGQESVLDLFGIKQTRYQFTETLSVTTKGSLALFWSSFMLIAISILFLIFIVVPMKAKKMLSR